MFYSKENLLINNKTTTEMYETLQELRKDINLRIDLIENLEFLSTILSHLIYEKQYKYKNEISDIKREREELERSNLNFTEFNAKVDELETKLQHIEQDEKLLDLNQQKNKTNERIEELMTALDFYLEQLRFNFKNFSNTISQSETCLLTENVSMIIDDYGSYISELEKLQQNQWRKEDLNIKFTSIIAERGLKVTKSGCLLTRNGDRITYEEAQNRGYFNKIYQTLNETLSFIRQSQSTPSSSSESSLLSQMSSQEVAYLKKTVGRPLTLALSEITMKQPRDPIHYLGQWLIRFRYNQDFDEIEKKEFEELMQERRRIAYERRKAFIETEARAVVFEIIARVEQIIYEKELKLIEDSMARALIVGEDYYEFEDYEQI